MHNSSLFFVAIIPPKKLCDEITQHKLKFSKNFESSHALKSPPHITLVPPFRFSALEEHKIEDDLIEVSKKCSSFVLSIRGFGAFAPRVIYLNIERSTPLHRMQSKVMSFFPFVRSHASYVPHLTIATRDLSKSMFHRAWGVYKNESFERDFKVNELSLLKHNGKTWEVFKTYPIDF